MTPPADLRAAMVEAMVKAAQLADGYSHSTPISAADHAIDRLYKRAMEAALTAQASVMREAGLPVPWE